jgi:NodT family efflux transporter outer membrane factor (OMF) lipoprotein
MLIMKLRILKYLALSFLMAGCGLFDNYTRPDIVRENLAGADTALPDSALFELPQWKEVFNDSKLLCLINKALLANSDLRKAQLNISQSEKMLKVSRLALLPSFAIEPSAQIDKFGENSASKTYTLPLTTAWEIDVFGRLRNSKEQARSVYYQSIEYEQMIQTQLITSVAIQYFTLVMLDAQLADSQENLMTFKETLVTLESLKSAGLQTDAGVRQAAANYKMVQISIEELKKQISLVENSICLLLNQTPQTIQRSVQSNVTIDSFENSLSLKVLSNRPDVKHAEFKLSQSFYGVAYARSSLYPSIKLSGGLGWSNSSGAIIANPANILLSSLVSITQPIFKSGENRARLKISQTKYEQELISFEKALLTAGNEVNSVLVERETAKKKCNLRIEQIKELDRALVTTKELMLHGRANYLEVLIAQNTRLKAKIAYSADWFEWIKSEVNFYKVLGGGS